MADTATYRAARKASPDATFVTVPGVDAASVELVKAGKADAIALSRESLTGLVPQIPGSRLLDGGFLNSVTAVAVPPNRPAARAYVTEFIEEAKASGLVRRAFDAAGLTAAQVAPRGDEAVRDRSAYVQADSLCRGALDCFVGLRPPRNDGSIIFTSLRGAKRRSNPGATEIGLTLDPRLAALAQPRLLPAVGIEVSGIEPALERGAAGRQSASSIANQAGVAGCAP